MLSFEDVKKDQRAIWNALARVAFKLNPELRRDLEKHLINIGKVIAHNTERIAGLVDRIDWNEKTVQREVQILRSQNRELMLWSDSLTEKAA